MSLSFRLQLDPQVRLVESADECQLSLETSRNRLALDGLSPMLVKIVRALATTGMTEAEAIAGLDGTGWEELVRLQILLERCHRLCWLEHTLMWASRPFLQQRVLSASNRTLVTAVDPAERYRLSRFAYLHRGDRCLVLESPQSRSQIILLDWRGGALLTLLAEAKSSRELVAILPSLPETILCQVLGLLLAEKFLEAVPAAESTAGESTAIGTPASQALQQWEFHDLLFHSRSRMGRHQNHTGKTRQFSGKIPLLPAIKSIDASYPRVALPVPVPSDLGALPFTEVLEARRSVREYGSEPISHQQLGEFLYRVARVRATSTFDGIEVTSRPYPSGGASYELEIYPVINFCDGIVAGIYYYNPQDHCLHKLRDRQPLIDQLLTNARQATSISGELQVLLVLAARFPRVMWGYRTISYTTILKNVGVLYQTMYLVATAMQLAPCAVGAGDSDLFAAAVLTDYYCETSVGEFILGSQKREP